MQNRREVDALIHGEMVALFQGFYLMACGLLLSHHLQGLVEFLEVFDFFLWLVRC